MSKAKCRVRSFWSPHRDLLLTVVVTGRDISIMDDNGRSYEAAGPEEDMAAKEKRLARENAAAYYGDIDGDFGYW